MTSLSTIIIGLFLSGSDCTQSAHSLGEAVAVELKTVTVEWNPSRECLAYSKAEDSGIGIGLYLVGTPHGSLLLHLKKSDAWNLQWFEGQDAAIVTVMSSDKNGKRLSVFLLEAKPALATKVLEEAAGQADNLSIDAEVSPLLEHAVFKLHKGDSVYRLVLPPGGTSLIRSTDLEQAASQSFIGPKWSSSGTAIYLDRKSADATFAVQPPNSGSSQDQLLWAILRSEIDSLANATPSGNSQSDELGLAFTKSMIQSLKDQLTTAPLSGEVSLELMPNNGVLRQVRSPGPWKESRFVEFGVAPRQQLADVTAGKMAGKSQSLWLISSDKKWTLLVAPSAENSWLSPKCRSIAYTVDGVLFVRSLRR